MSSMCSQVQLVFQIELTVEASLTVGKIIHFGLMVKAYQVAKEKHDQEEKKKRRKDRYNQMLRKRYIYDEKRKV
jgi:ABC-type microcin C transport system duplicated ATPase subunit YejF